MEFFGIMDDTKYYTPPPPFVTDTQVLLDG